MSITVIGDRDTVFGFGLIGVDGRVVEREEEVERALDEILEREETRLLLITRNLAQALRKRIDRLKMSSLHPIVMEIPGREGARPERSISDLVRSAIGINV